MVLPTRGEGWGVLIFFLSVDGSQSFFQLVTCGSKPPVHATSKQPNNPKVLPTRLDSLLPTPQGGLGAPALRGDEHGEASDQHVVE